jgi:outer membrane lipoprotein-sorting protein
MTVLLALAFLAQLVPGEGRQARVQGESAEETFKKIEASIEKAKTISIAFTVDGKGAKEGPDRELKAKGTFLLKEGGIFNCSVKLMRQGQEEETTLVFDGTRTSVRRDQGDPMLSDVPKAHRGSAITLLARLGAFMSGLMPRGAGGPEEDIKKVLEVKDFKAGEDDNEAKTLLFTAQINVPGGARTPAFDCRLWYDPKTFKLFKRTITIRQGTDVEGTMTESYTEYVINAPIPDEKFKVETPKPKDK